MLFILVYLFLLIGFILNLLFSSDDDDSQQGSFSTSQDAIDKERFAR